MYWSGSRAMTDQAMDDGLEELEVEDTPAKGKSGKLKKLLLFVVAPIVVVAALGAGAFVMLGSESTGTGEAEEDTARAPTHAPIFYDLPDMLVNLNGSGRKLNFLKINVSLEVENEEDIPMLKSMLPRIIDNFQVYLRELRIEDLRGSEGIYRLREELLRRVNMAVQPIRVNDVLFKEMLVQ